MEIADRLYGVTMEEPGVSQAGRGQPARAAASAHRPSRDRARESRRAADCRRDPLDSDAALTRLDARLLHFTRKANGHLHHRRVHQLRRLRAGVPERSDQRGRRHLRHRPEAVHRVRRASTITRPARPSARSSAACPIRTTSRPKSSLITRAKSLHPDKEFGETVPVALPQERLTSRSWLMRARLIVAIDGPAGAGQVDGGAAAGGAARLRAARHRRDLPRRWRCARASAASRGTTVRASRRWPTASTSRSASTAPSTTCSPNGEDVTTAIRTPEISDGASRVSALPEVRAALLELQRRIGARGRRGGRGARHRHRRVPGRRGEVLPDRHRRRARPPAGRRAARPPAARSTSADDAGGDAWRATSATRPARSRRCARPTTPSRSTRARSRADEVVERRWRAHVAARAGRQAGMAALASGRH